jgi:hypothetical protein
MMKLWKDESGKFLDTHKFEYDWKLVLPFLSPLVPEIQLEFLFDLKAQFEEDQIIRVDIFDNFKPIHDWIPKDGQDPQEAINDRDEIMRKNMVDHERLKATVRHLKPKNYFEERLNIKIEASKFNSNSFK